MIRVERRESEVQRP